MLIQSFRIENYKGFRDSGEIRLGEGFNVVVGRNTVGKTALTEALALAFSSNAHRSLETIPVPGAAPPPVSRATVRFRVGSDELKELCRAGALGDALYVPTAGPGQDPAYHLRIAESLVERGPVVETDRTVVFSGPGSFAVEPAEPFLVGYEARKGSDGTGHTTYWKGDAGADDLYFPDGGR